MPLFADRFLSQSPATATDLATGLSVRLSVSCTGGDAERRRWMARCETLQKLHHPALAPLVDYGEVGSSQRFEAWRCDGPWLGPPELATEVQERASLILRACGLSEGACNPSAIVDGPAGPVLVPDTQAGYPIDAGVVSPSLPLCSRAILLQERRAVGALAELFERRDGSRPKVAAVWGPRGAGKQTVVNELARSARALGFVPVSASIYDHASRHLTGRSLFLIGDGDRAQAWRVLLSAALATRVAHVLLFVGAEEVPFVDGVGLEPLRVETLAAAVHPAITIELDVARVRRAAARVGGWPGPFASWLWSDGRAIRVAEQPASYEVEPRPLPSVHRLPSPDLAEHRQKVEAGVRLIGAGRHAPGERMLRQAIGALSRREDWSHAGEGSVALAELLIRRGRLKEAQTTLKQAGDCWTAAPASHQLVDVAILSGAALTELAQLEEAEVVLSAAVASARSMGEHDRTSRALANLARVLFWQGRYDEAERTLRSAGPAANTDRESMRVGRLATAIAIGRRALDAAVSLSDEAMRRASELNAAGPIAEAACGAAFAHLAVGDLAAVERDALTCVRAALLLRDPLLATRARIILAEAWRRSGRRTAASRILRRISRISSTVLPPIVRARYDLLQDALSSSRIDGEMVARHAAASGLKALELYVPGSQSPRSAEAFGPILDDIVHILDVCQTSDDESAILTEACRRIRARVHAASVSCLTAEGSTWTVVASEGPRGDPAIAARTVETGSTIAPHRCDDRIEAGAPVRYAGSILGAVVVRWPIGLAADLGHVAGLLTAAAAVIAPIFSAAIVKRRRAPPPGLHEIIGISPAIAEVRRAVERAAGAPFSVLIEGESGAGKEIVARALHRCSPRRDRPFGTLNCAALPDDLVEAELFGHARGAFTGAIAERPGVFEDAHGGTLFLDEIGELSLRAQAKVLRVLQDGEVKRVGENAARRIDVRIVAATNRDLRREVAAGRFRLDLSYRLDVIRIVVPPLRARAEDVALLAEHYWRESAARVGSRATLSTSTMAALARYDWPGNVRELQNVLASLVVRSPKRGVVPPTALGSQFGERRYVEAARLDEARRTFEERFVRAALARTGGQRGQAARELGVTRQGLSKLMARLGIETDDS